ncbi:MAG: tyrosine--tRNA ligase [Actinomycetota bacterium]
MTTTATEQLELLTRNAAEVIPTEELTEKLKAGRPLRVKLGLDPTAEHVTLGWTVVLRKLREFQDLGHTAVLIVGDYTARIGDPSEAETTRPMLTKDEVDAHAARVLDQISLILAEDNLEIRRNSEWLDPLGTTGVLELATHYTVARMLERDDFAKRYAAEQPISLREFLYPLLQGYDSVAVRSDVELGGTDQHFNLMVGRHIQRAYGQDPQVVVSMPLIEGTDGVKKMSQSVGNYVAVTEPADEIFGKLMRLPDQLMIKYFRLTTALTPIEIGAIERDLESGALRPEAAKRRLAQSVVELYHGADAADAALTHFDRVFKNRELPDEADIAEFPLPADCVADGSVDIPCAMKTVGLAKSLSDARRKLEQGGVRIDGEPVSEGRIPVDKLKGRVLQVGKRRFARLV